jgi:hypothetical protein
LLALESCQNIFFDGIFLSAYRAISCHTSASSVRQERDSIVAEKSLYLSYKAHPEKQRKYYC